jgi:hypothetical protein
VPEVCRAAVRETDSQSPDVADARFYERSHKIYQAMYPALKPICADIAAL